MGLFRRIKSRKQKKDLSYQNIDKINDADDAAAAESPPRLSLSGNISYNSNKNQSPFSYGSSYNSSNSSSYDYNHYKNETQDTFELDDIDDDDKSHNKDDDNSSNQATIDDVPTFVQAIQSCDETYSLKPAKALRSLFALSEDDAFHEINRIRMVREEFSSSLSSNHNQQQLLLVPILLDFIQRCESSSSEQYLALLVLNNVSIPKENKRLIAIEWKGAEILCRLLCQNPNIPLIGIILVNLSFCDSLLRKQLVDDLHKNIQFIEALSYVLKVSY